MRVVIGAGGYWVRGGSAPNALGVEILAQAAARLLVDVADPRPGGARLLVGLEAVEFEQPALPIGLAWARVEPVGALGRLVKIRGELTDAAGGLLLRATLLLAA